MALADFVFEFLDYRTSLVVSPIPSRCFAFFGWISYKKIETPMRGKNWDIDPKFLNLIAISSSLAATLLLGLLYKVSPAFSRKK